MRSVIVTEEQLADKEALLRSMLEEGETDPRSCYYKRTLTRPAIPWRSAAGFALLILLLTAAAGVLCYLFGCSGRVAFLAAFAVFFLLHLLLAQRILLFLIHLYQRYAPDSLRNKCRFEPSCSVYMEQSVRKYGVWRGVRCGIRRLRRCNVNGGGFDPV